MVTTVSFDTGLGQHKSGFRTHPETPVNYRHVIRRDVGAGRPRRQEERPMDPLKICSVEFDDRDPYRATFNVHLSRDMTDFERQALPPLLSSGFSPSEARGSAVVAIRNATITMIEDHRDLLKQIVAEAETLARTMEHEQHAIAAQIAARVEGVEQRAAAIDWS